MMNRFLFRVLYPAAMVGLISGCAAAERHATQDAGTTFMALEARFVTTEGSWLDADVALLSATCARIDAHVGTSLRANPDALEDYTEHKKICDGLSDVRSNAARLRKQGAAADSGDGYENINHKLEDLRSALDSTIQAFPTSAFRQSNFPPAAATDYRARHEALATDAGQIAVEAVQNAREASGSAMDLASSSSHELDKTRAKLADEAYTQASSELQSLQSTTNAPEIIGKVAELLSTCDGAIGSAQGTGRVGGNPVAGAQEALPSASSPTPLPPTPRPSLAAEPADVSQSGTIADDSGRQENAVQAFYSNISQKNYSAAYSLLSNRYRSGTSFGPFAQGYSTTIDVKPQARARADGSGNVDVILDAQDLKDGRTVQTRFVGYWHLVKAAGGDWVLDNGKFSVDNQS